jgi:mRNA deadenylase 3'-5' endonuclease subunit Ccr4
MTSDSYKLKYTKCAVLLRTLTEKLKEEKEKNEIKRSIEKYRSIRTVVLPDPFHTSESMDVLTESLELVDLLNSSRKITR